MTKIPHFEFSVITRILLQSKNNIVGWIVQKMRFHFHCAFFIMYCSLASLWLVKVPQVVKILVHLVKIVCVCNCWKTVAKLLQLCETVCSRFTSVE